MLPHRLPQSGLGLMPFAGATGVLAARSARRVKSGNRVVRASAAAPERAWPDNREGPCRHWDSQGVSWGTTPHDIGTSQGVMGTFIP